MTAPAPTETFEQRRHRCYELAGRFALNAHDEDLLLVHGTVQRDPYPPNPHAWVTFTKDGIRWAFDGVLNAAMPAEYYTEWANAAEVVTYTHEAMALASLRTGHWGPWHD